ncbi:hypothetical protein HMPREF3039_01458 [Akkermansia sp. KLE1798]|nr:hypothetical protein HMPREF3039_01458 [Akkermansia sp. KLE1798]
MPFFFYSQSFFIPIPRLVHGVRHTGFPPSSAEHPYFYFETKSGLGCSS